MREEVALAELGEVGIAPPGRYQPIVTVVKRRRRIDRFDLAVLAAFACLSVWVLALDLWQVVAHGMMWTGTDGVYLVDQMQYLAWIREAARHVLASNLFVLHPTPADYFQPAVAISGGLTALGMAPWLALLLWKPVAVGATFFAVRAYTRRSLTRLWQRRAALVLGLFFGSFSIVYGSFGVVGDLFPTFESWGYTFGLLAVAALVLALISYDRARIAGRLRWTPALFGALAGLLHPWQGELLVVIVLATELAIWRAGERRRAPLSLPAVTVIVTAIPLLYYFALGHVDESWSLARDASKHSFAIWTVALAIGPLALPAMLGYRGRSRGFLQAATRIWPLAALFVYLVSATGLSATPLHAFDGITIPLAVLAVYGVCRTRFTRLRRRRVLASLAVAAATIPATVFLLWSARGLVVPTGGNANFITADESHALSYLARDPTPGGVLTRFYLGTVVPAEASRATFVGDCLWSEPGCTPRAQLAQQLLDGTLAPSTARSFVLSTGTRFVLADCASPADLGKLLGPVVVSARSFGCARVYEVR